MEVPIRQVADHSLSWESINDYFELVSYISASSRVCVSVRTYIVRLIFDFKNFHKKRSGLLTKSKSSPNLFRWAALFCKSRFWLYVLVCMFFDNFWRQKKSNLMRKKIKFNCVCFLIFFLWLLLFLLLKHSTCLLMLFYNLFDGWRRYIYQILLKKAFVDHEIGYF